MRKKSSPSWGIYQYRRRVKGCSAFYAISKSGTMAGFLVVHAGTTKAEVVAALHASLRPTRAPKRGAR